MGGGENQSEGSICPDGSQSQPSIVSGDGVQLWSERGDLLLQLGDPGAVANTVTLSSDGRYIIR